LPVNTYTNRMDSWTLLDSEPNTTNDESKNDEWKAIHTFN